jgi:hypothetical protein
MMSRGPSSEPVSMNVDSPALLERILQVLPVSSQQRLLIMGWEEFPPPRDPARLLLRAIGAPTPVHLVDLEQQVSRWLGQHVTTQGTIRAPLAPESPPCIGKLALCLGLLPPSQLAQLQHSTERFRLTGIVLHPTASPEPSTTASGPRPSKGLLQPATVASLAVVSIAPGRDS